MEVRVVCGLSATMATFCPTRALSKVDLPALGRPTRETNPERKASLMGHGLRLADFHLAHAQLVAGQHLEADPIAPHEFAGGRHGAEPFRHKASHGGGFYVLFAVERFEEIAHAVNIEIAGDDIAAHAVLGDVAVRL